MLAARLYGQLTSESVGGAGHPGWPTVVGLRHWCCLFVRQPGVHDVCKGRCCFIPGTDLVAIQQLPFAVGRWFA